MPNASAHIARLAVWLPVWFGGTLAASWSLDPILIIGGVKCGSTSFGFDACMGYPPTGFVFIGIGSILAVGVCERLARRTLSRIQRKSRTQA